jgi:methylthioribose-1-phosphate isomerase
MVLQAIRFDRRRGTTADSESSASLEILDQLLLPHRTQFVAISSCEDAHAAIKKMQVRGAPAIAIVAALALATQLTRETTSRELPNSADRTRDLIGSRLEYLQTSRPTAVNLGDAVSKLKRIAAKAAAEPSASATSVVDAYVDAAEVMLSADVSDNEAIGEYGADWIRENTEAGVRRSKDPEQQLQVLTHCNTG